MPAAPDRAPIPAARHPDDARSKRLRALARAVSVAGLACLGACQDYLARRDTLTVGSGEAVHANAAMQVIDPWPAHARTVEPTVNGERLQHAVERYRNPGVGQNIAVLPPVPIGPPNVPSVAPPTAR